ncbi:hypothetical protein Psal006b_02954 [Piscirickettsia salmonis]|uniref:Uncharacterized protein n=1 Tax=Piscirickettsia salmonis TaxID=1238 RepID=A0AAC8ZNA0_PISSA|nr:hypothetical protein [Piscirickettsia salmonis]ALB21452.1 hypothetical protein KU39_268 [Piscirickettsia salmonis]ALT18090.1 hypothetical protein PSLF89_03755 [Piscirickettsia salmonis LF-89 = ATCC VR-1361]ALY01678.1 hypothetical protein AWE47_01340 [Piscirickettsia salmonis]AMA41194.1 hypothetical protein AWJ11_01350 [Piscirickettsia salmonis]AOS36382.1 hypothetical protein AVM72_14335 [Piscirickettsia salmonis]
MKLNYQQLEKLADYLNNEYADVGINFYADIDSLGLKRVNCSNNVNSVMKESISSDEIKLYWRRYCQKTGLLFDKTLFNTPVVSNFSTSNLSEDIEEDNLSMPLSTLEAERARILSFTSESSSQLPILRFQQAEILSSTRKNSFNIIGSQKISQKSSYNSFSTLFLQEHHAETQKESGCPCVVL